MIGCDGILESEGLQKIMYIWISSCLTRIMRRYLDQDISGCVYTVYTDIKHLGMDVDSAVSVDSQTDFENLEEVYDILAFRGVTLQTYQLTRPFYYPVIHLKARYSVTAMNYTGCTRKEKKQSQQIPRFERVKTPVYFCKMKT